MEPRVALSLNVLLQQINEQFPNRNKASDGAIGDAAHASRDSDHNPWYVIGGQGIVTARDFTHDPDKGLDCHWLANRLVASRDPRIKYFIWDRHIWTPRKGWLNYYGANPHTTHLHLSVVAALICDSGAQWILNIAPAPPRKEYVMKVVRLCRNSQDLSSGIFVVTPGGHWKLPNSNALRHFCFKWGLKPMWTSEGGDIEDVDDISWWGPRLDTTA